MIEWVGGKEGTLSAFRDKLCRSVATSSSLVLLARWHAINKQIRNLGLGLLSDAISRGDLFGDSCGKAYEYSVYQRILEARIHANPILQSFGHIKYESLRQRFANLDKAILALNGRHIASNLLRVSVAEGIGSGPVSAYTEKRLLIKEAGKQKRHIPIRQLVRRAKNAIQALKPCFLMSPLSVAQYLAPGEIEFDLVVMDEASQIRPEDALGAVARARKAIIVGDPKQLPPTRFFDTAIAEDDDSDETIIDDTESVLDVCLKQLPYRRLRWHYRSQHESLIQFSNDQFYNGDLIVFPSPKRDARDFGVHLTYVDNPSYNSGRNRAEAEIVVENIIHHFQRYRDKSLGVAAFNKRQAEEIELILDRARLEDPAIDELISRNEAEEPLFIKNLENVQGDERDVIFISTTYGPEKHGAPVFQRFGPLNSDLGWRRLNVIATRARQRVEVFTSMRPIDIRIDVSTRKGIRALRAYLEYAESGRFSDLGKPTGGSPESEFEVAVAKILNDLGYECVPQVGVAGFFVDIGLLHPDRPGEFLMGIECDGAPYHSARSIRDRDRLRQEILESKGWFIHRIWSTTWFHTRLAEIDRLVRTISERLEEDRRRWKLVSTNEQSVEMVTVTRQPETKDIEQQDEKIGESLEETLERYWAKNIQPQFPDRESSILSRRMIQALTARRPDTEVDWFKAVSLELRQHMNPKERNFLPDILDVIAEYA
ncbi:MAG: hypothetical protein A3F68_09325 [Acidobacteria bacterium RIFCSPLOWO2_12_FULL_54_10]|nr:MAG: hypothetical protein A3F68_09325 [Acidobacteria bacterium RIFCSPLOWO2_12_FULL_54_10]